MTTPMYQDIADQLRERIESEEFESGQLPTEQDLQSEYSASRNTIREAIKQLTTLGLVETKPGQGTFVVPPIDPFVTTLTTNNPDTARGGDEGASYASEISDEHREPSFSPVQVEIQDASPEVASGLWIKPDDEVISGISGASSTAYPGRCKRRSTRGSLPIAAQSDCGEPRILTRERSRTCRRRSVSGRSVTGTGLPSGPRTPPKPSSSSFPKMDGLPFTRYFGRVSTETGDQCVLLSRFSRLIVTSSLSTLAMYHRPSLVRQLGIEAKSSNNLLSDLTHPALV